MQKWQSNDVLINLPFRNGFCLWAATGCDLIPHIIASSQAMFTNLRGEINVFRRVEKAERRWSFRSKPTKVCSELWANKLRAQSHCSRVKNERMVQQTLQQTARTSKTESKKIDNKILKQIVVSLRKFMFGSSGFSYNKLAV